MLYACKWISYNGHSMVDSVITSTKEAINELRQKLLNDVLVLKSTIEVHPVYVGITTCMVKLEDDKTLKERTLVYYDYLDGFYKNVSDHCVEEIYITCYGY